MYVLYTSIELYQIEPPESKPLGASQVSIRFLPGPGDVIHSNGIACQAMLV